MKSLVYLKDSISGIRNKPQKTEKRHGPRTLKLCVFTDIFGILEKELPDFPEMFCRSSGFSDHYSQKVLLVKSLDLMCFIVNVTCLIIHYLFILYFLRRVSQVSSDNANIREFVCVATNPR